ncbi:hypothetical protein [Bacillus horti]|uniref:Uncharacterized protein n=1 Tax=Caldalkalibacillus horti TaxID=77523 RepID=A0ABT9W3A5_9BACI|nr:hypothetical protein [Bacillus horti]MDQ0167552.1 hypothetical protein [Bacillus horti]
MKQSVKKWIAGYTVLAGICLFAGTVSAEPNSVVNPTIMNNLQQLAYQQNNDFV